MPKKPHNQQKQNKSMDSFSWLFPQSANQLNRIEQKVDILMAAVQIQQEDLDAFATEINNAVEAVAAEIAALVADTGNPLTEADVTALQTAVDNLKALEPPATEPAPEEPAAE